MRFEGQRLSNKNQLNNFRLAVFSRARQKTGFFVDLARDSGFQAAFRVKNLKIPIPGRATDSGTRRNPFINNMFLNFQLLKLYLRISTSCISRLVSSLFWHSQVRILMLVHSLYMGDVLETFGNMGIFGKTTREIQLVEIRW